MKKLTLLLVFVPIFLMTALNFTGGNTIDEHPPYLKGFTCSSCHATIIDGIIINGKTRYDLSSVEVSIELPSYVSYTAIQVDIKDAENPTNGNFPVYFESDYGTTYNTNIDKDFNGKKANILTFDIPLDEFQERKEIEIQGLLTNGDGTNEGDYSFAQKLVLKEKGTPEEFTDFSIFPTVANSQITLKGLEESSMVSIINVNGQLVYQGVISATSEVIDVSNFEDGFYFVNANETTSKIIVRK